MSLLLTKFSQFHMHGGYWRGLRQQRQMHLVTSFRMEVIYQFFAFSHVAAIDAIG